VPGRPEAFRPALRRHPERSCASLPLSRFSRARNAVEGPLFDPAASSAPIPAAPLPLPLPLPSRRHSERSAPVLLFRVRVVCEHAGTRSRRTSLRCKLRRDSNPREVLRLRPAPAKTAGNAKPRGTPLRMTFVCGERRRIYTRCGKSAGRKSLLQRATFARAEKIANQRNAHVEGHQ
jgi:hypothetical protein